MTAEELKLLFSQPLMLLLLMLFGALSSAAKQLVVARRQNAAITVGEYFLKIETVIMLVGVIFTWIGLVAFEQLNIGVALGAGYIANDLADAATKEGRSAAVIPPPEAKKDAH